MHFEPEEISKRLDFFKDLLSCHSKFYLWTFDSQGYLLNTNCEELIINKLFMVSESFTYLMEYIKDHKEPLVMSSELGIMWSSALEYSGTDKLRRIHVLGPVFVNKPSQAEIDKVLRKPNISHTWKPTLLKLLNDIPVITTTSFFQQTIMLHYCITGEKITTSDIIFQKSEIQSLNKSTPEIKRDRMRLYRSEQAMLQMVRDGNLNYKSALEGAMNASSGTQALLSSGISKVKTSQIIFITLCTRAAIEGGLSPEIAYTRSDAYIEDVIKCNTISEASSIGRVMYDDFIHLVHNNKMNPKVDKQIQSCCDYIEHHVEEKLTLADLAKRIGYAEYYLSRKFKEETGLSINTYIKREKIKRAMLLLTTTQDSIQKISEDLNFGTRSFFADTFKQIVGITPAAYRKENQVI